MEGGAVGYPGDRLPDPPGLCECCKKPGAASWHKDPRALGDARTDWEVQKVMTSSPSIFESFNARSLDPTQVAETFVPSLMFRKLAKRRHTIIVGPRGSGKTTLLKMLQQSALEAWTHPEAEK